MNSRARGQAPVGWIAGMLAVSLVLGALASLATRHSDPAPVDQAGPYIGSLDGALARGAAAPGAGGGSSGGGAGSAGGADGSVAAKAPVATSSAAAGRLVASSGPRSSARLSTGLGREVASLLDNADVSVLAIGTHGGSFAYSDTDGWLRLDGDTWVVCDYASLPADLKASYPPEVYGNRLQRGEKGGEAGAGGGAAAGTRSAPAGARDATSAKEAFDPKQGRVTFAPSLQL